MKLWSDSYRAKMEGCGGGGGGGAGEVGGCAADEKLQEKDMEFGETRLHV